jgi:hypothetical protein
MTGTFMMRAASIWLREPWHTARERFRRLYRSTSLLLRRKMLNALSDLLEDTRQGWISTSMPARRSNSTVYENLLAEQQQR